jgi:hypothetical protein
MDMLIVLSYVPVYKDYHLFISMNEFTFDCKMALLSLITFNLFSISFNIPRFIVETFFTEMAISVFILNSLTLMKEFISLLY